VIHAYWSGYWSQGNDYCVTMDELNDAAMKTTDEQFDCDKQATQAVRNNPHDCGKFTTVPCSYGDDIAKKSRTDLTKCESTNVEQSAGGSNGSGDVPRNEDTHVCNDKNNDTSTPDAMNDEAQTSNADTEHVMALRYCVILYLNKQNNDTNNQCTVSCSSGAVKCKTKMVITREYF